MFIVTVKVPNILYKRVNSRNKVKIIAFLLKLVILKRLKAWTLKLQSPGLDSQGQYSEHDLWQVIPSL